MCDHVGRVRIFDCRNIFASQPSGVGGDTSVGGGDTGVGGVDNGVYTGLPELAALWNFSDSISANFMIYDSKVTHADSDDGDDGNDNEGDNDADNYNGNDYTYLVT